jgi:hypothetical protein
MKRTDLDKQLGKQINNRIRNAGSVSPFKRTESVIDKKEQRRKDQALGLVPFAVKLNENLIGQINVIAAERKIGINELVAELLIKGLEA